MGADGRSSSSSVCDPSQVLPVYHWGDPDVNRNDRLTLWGRAVVTQPRMGESFTFPLLPSARQR
jgi:hypothetical protein